MFTEKSWKAATSPFYEVAEDIIQIQLPLPYALNHVNVYLVKGDTGWTIVDCGLNISPARAIWESAFERYRIQPGDVEQIVVTHLHPDHFGMAGWLQDRLSTDLRAVPVYLSGKDYAFFDRFWGDLDRFAPPMADMMVACGLPPAFAQEVMAGTLRTGQKTLPLPEISSLPTDADGMARFGNRRLRPIEAPGHADGQSIFYDASARLMFSGDQILMKITPNIGYWHDTEAGVLQRYLDSLKELNELEVTLGLPGHKWLIDDWQSRIEAMFVHHDDRLAHTFDAVQPEGTTVHAVSQAVFRLKELNIHQSRFAVAETRAHLDLLEGRGDIRCETRDGIWYYSPA